MHAFKSSYSKGYKKHVLIRRFYFHKYYGLNVNDFLHMS